MVRPFCDQMRFPGERWGRSIRHLEKVECARGRYDGTATLTFIIAKGSANSGVDEHFSAPPG